MKKAILVSVLALIILIISFTLILSSCNKNNGLNETYITDIEQDSVSETTITTVVTVQNDNTVITESESSSFSEEETENGGGNQDSYIEIEITISENRYYYNNSEISLESLIELFDGLDKNDTVKIHDDYASDKAYENLLSALKEREIPYTEE